MAIFFLTLPPMKITRWAAGGHSVFLKNLVLLSIFPLAMSAMHNSGWFKVVMSKHGQKKVKEVQPPAFKPTASLPVVSPVVPATKALPALSLLGMLGLLLVSAPMDGNCYLHCAVCILKKADSKKHAATTHDSLRAEMCAEFLRNRC